jgi:lysophospholipase L1-like esterase
VKSRMPWAPATGLFLALCVCMATACCAAAPLSGGRDVWNIIFVGDSITDGSYLGHRTRNAPPATCSAGLRKRLPHAAIYMANEGYSGDTTADFLPSTGTHFAHTEQDARLLQQAHPGRLVFSIMLGTNDSAQYGPNGSPVAPAKFEQNLREIMGRLLTDFPGSMIVIQQPTWYSPNTANRSEYGAAGLARLQSYFPLLPKIAASLPEDVFVGDTQAYDLFRKRSSSLLRRENGQHGVFYLHPNHAGAKLLGLAWADAILPHLEQALSTPGVR